MEIRLPFTKIDDIIEFPVVPGRSRMAILQDFGRFCQIFLAAIFLPEDSKISIFLPKLCDLTFFLPEFSTITIFLQETSKTTIALKEYRKITIFLPDLSR